MEVWAEVLDEVIVGAPFQVADLFLVVDYSEDRLADSVVFSLSRFFGEADHLAALSSAGCSVFSF